MTSFFYKVPFLFELFYNGVFILLYSLRSIKKLPDHWDPVIVDLIISYGAWGIPFVILAGIASQFHYLKSINEFFRKHIFSIIVLFPLIMTWGDLEFAFWLSSAHLLSSVLYLYDSDAPKAEKTFELSPESIYKKLRLTPAQLVMISFGSVITLGTFLLMLPVSVAEGKSLGLLDALFMSTSATCVTGLATKSVGTDLSLFGQAVILGLIQVGGLSIMTLVSSMTILLGRSMGMKDRIILQDMLDVSSLEDLFSMIIDIIKYTFFIELWGGVVLTIAFAFDDFEFGTALYYGFFHSISAFCNAGFSLFDTSLESYASNPLVNITIMVLITLGGIGFICLKEMRQLITGKLHYTRISFHTKIVLVTSLVLTASGTIFFFFGEFLNALDGYELWDKVMISMFQSVTLRTAGFNTIPMTSLHSYSLYLMILFMFIGGSPGSTAGGIKTTSLAILVQSIKTTLKGRDKVIIFDRKIPSQVVVKTTALTFISIIIVSFFVLILMKFESNQSFLSIVFEVVSASGTVGLSLGMTTELSAMGKLAITVAMFIGRIGPLTMVLAIGQQSRSEGKFDYPDGKIMIG